MRWVVAVLILLGSSGSVRAQQVYSVSGGDALGLLADRFGVSVDDLREWNGLDGDRIFVGQELVVAPDRSAGPAEDTYRVQPGDTLSGVALRVGVGIEQLRELNPDVDPNRIRVGQELRIGTTRRRVEHVVARGESLSAVAARYGVSVAEMLEWNRGLRPDLIRVGRRLVVFTDQPESRSKSIGLPYRGVLEDGVRLRAHRAYVIRDTDKTWGTEETVRWLLEGFDAVLRAHPNAPRVRVHDISHRRGGFMSGHRSHQSGRDVDISYYQRNCGGRPCPMWNMSPEHLDAEIQWTLFEHWLRHDRLEAIFVDYRFQAVLHREARRRGATAAELARWFQYPNGPTHPVGIIRHYPQHRDHAHVRFACHESDPECITITGAR